eukprot:466538-Lingulodinium_polyedra.AAC.1
MSPRGNTSHARTFGRSEQPGTPDRSGGRGRTRCGSMSTGPRSEHGTSSANRAVPRVPEGASS